MLLSEHSDGSKNSVCLGRMLNCIRRMYQIYINMIAYNAFAIINCEFIAPHSNSICHRRRVWSQRCHRAPVINGLADVIVGTAGQSFVANRLSVDDTCRTVPANYRQHDRLRSRHDRYNITYVGWILGVAVEDVQRLSALYVVYRV